MELYRESLGGNRLLDGIVEPKLATAAIGGLVDSLIEEIGDTYCAVMKQLTPPGNSSTSNSSSGPSCVPIEAVTPLIVGMSGWMNYRNER